MILAIDVFYKNNHAKCVGFLFNWIDEEPKQIVIEYINDIEEYQPGMFFKRELPCLLRIIQQVDLEEIDTIVIDGYVYVSNDKKLGLGGELWKSIGETIPIIGVAKNKFHDNTEHVKSIIRGSSKKPLYISSIGMLLEEAANHILCMKGSYRIPTLLKKLDYATKHSN